MYRNFGHHPVDQRVTGCRYLKDAHRIQVDGLDLGPTGGASLMNAAPRGLAMTEETAHAGISSATAVHHSAGRCDAIRVGVDGFCALRIVHKRFNRGAPVYASRSPVPS